MPDRLTPFFGWCHLDGYRFLGVDINVDIPGLITRLENPSRVVIGRVQPGAFSACRQPVEGGLLGTPDPSRAKTQPKDECKREQALLFESLGIHGSDSPTILDCFLSPEEQRDR